MAINQNYLNTAKRRFEINKAGWKASQRLFDSARREYRGVEIGHRWSLYGYSKLDGLYEITNINRSKMDGKVYFTVKKVLKTKVSAQSSKHHEVAADDMMDHPNNSPFEPYNEIVSDLWNKHLNDNV